LAQVGNPKIDIGTIEFNPAGGNQQQEYIQLVNNGDTSVDMSGWHLGGDIQWTFDPGTVLPAGFTLYASPDVRAFRTRTEGPTGGMKLFVQGNYEGHLPNEGGTVQLLGADGQLVSEVTYTGTPSLLQDNLRISEIMYNPLEASAVEQAVDNSLISEDFEYIELVNISSTETLDLNGARFIGGVEFDFTGSAITQLAPSERALVVRNTSAFAIRYGQQSLGRVAGIFAANTALRDSGERLTLMSGDGFEIVDLEYSDNDYQGWPARADGDGSSLQIIDPLGDYQEPTNWRASSEIHGSPGAVELPPVGGIVINEVLSRSTAPQTDQVELYNTTGQAINLANYYLSDSSADIDALKKFALPNVSIPAGGFLVLTEQQFNAGGGQNPNDFALSGDNGDQLYLTVGDATGPKRFVDDVIFGASAVGESFGRTPNGTGRLYPTVAPSLAASNGLPRVGPIVITEVMFAAGDPSPQALAIDANVTADDLEYIEIYNPTAATVDLTAWRTRRGVDFDFDDGTQLPTLQSLLIVSFDTSNAARLQAFRTHYGINDTVPIVGPYVGQLSAMGDGIQLQRPGTPPQGEPDFIPRLLEDEVIYDNIAPWPADAGSGGRSLSRVAANAYGNAAASWTSTDPTPGTFGGDITGDLTDDGRVDAQDVEWLHQAGVAGNLAGDLTGNGVVDQDDLVFLVVDVMGTQIGDVDFDGFFDSHDLVLMFQTGEFEDTVADNSSYSDGDWNFDGEFTSNDLLFALQRGGYSGQPQNAPAALAANLAAAAIDEPATAGRLADDQPRLELYLAADAATGRRPLSQAASYDQIFADFDANLRERGDDESTDFLADDSFPAI
jgi:hypothetical protein